MIRFFAAHPTAANLLMLIFLGAGTLALPTLQRETFPRIEPRRVEVQVPYPGARAETVEDAICLRIEDAVDGLTDLRELKCEAKQSLGRAVLEMVEGGDLDSFYADVKTEIDAIDDFPDKAETPVIRQLGMVDFVASIAVTGPDDRRELKALAEDIKARMLRHGGIPQVEIAGFSQRQIRIEVTDIALRQLGLSINDIADAVARQSVDLPSGEIETADGIVSLRFADERRRASAFRDLVIVGGDDGGQITLGDIAHIEDRFETDEDRYLFNGRVAAQLNINKSHGDDTLEVIAEVRDFMDAELAASAPGVGMTIINDVSSVVQDRLSLLVRNGLQGIVLVFLAMWLFFGFRYSFWIAAGLPVSLFGAIALMQVLGYSLNLLTMVGLLMVIGIVMDDAIVISENIKARRRRGEDGLEAVVNGVRQVLPGVVLSFTTTVAVFGSLAFLEGDIGHLLAVIPAVMIAVLLVSLAEAFLILPHHLSHSVDREDNRVQEKVDGWLRDFRDRRLAPLVGKAVQYRYLTLGLAFFLLFSAMAVFAGGFIKFSVFPDVDGDTVELRILMPKGTPLSETEAVVTRSIDAIRRIDDRLSGDQPDGERLMVNIVERYGVNTDAAESGPHVATVSVDLLTADRRSITTDPLLTLWAEETGPVPEALNLRFTPAQIGPAGKAIELRLKGDDLDELQAAANDLADWFARYDGVRSIEHDLRAGEPEIAFTLKPGAKSLGFDASMISDQLRSAFFGRTAAEFQSGPESYEVDVRLADRDASSMGDLDYFTVVSPDGLNVPISAVADLHEDRGFTQLTRIDGRRTVTVEGDVDTSVANANEIVNDTLARFVPELEARYPGIDVGVEGQSSEGRKTQGSMVQGFLIGLFLVFLLLSFQFRSYLEPVVVMTIIPLSLVGSVFGHMLLGFDFTMPSMLGLVSLAGIVVNDSILLVMFLKEARAEGAGAVEAATEASRRRFRAIFLTSLTTIAGLLPILSETSLQAQVLIPLVVSLAFGLLATTVSILFVVPSFYVILDDLKLTEHHRAKPVPGSATDKAESGGVAAQP
jgi:multidrug efflux pump subunit AcrB